MVARCLILLATLLSCLIGQLWSFVLFHGIPFRHHKQIRQQRTRKSVILDFMSAVTDVPLQSINNLSISTGTELSFRIKEAKVQDLASIVSLRVNVFFPEVSDFYSIN